MIEKLIQQSKDGNNDSCEKLINSCNSFIMQHSLKYTNNNYDWAEEVAQKTRIKIFKSIKTFRGDCAFNTWVYFLIKNSFLDTTKRQFDNIFTKTKDNVNYLEDFSSSNETNGRDE